MGTGNRTYKVVLSICFILLFFSCKSLQSTNSVKQEAITNTGQLGFKRTVFPKEKLCAWLPKGIQYAAYDRRNLKRDHQGPKEKTRT